MTASETPVIRFPLATSELSEWIPHRQPMVWVDEVSWVTSDEGECIAEVKKTAHYMSTQGLRQSTLLEWMAQSFAFVSVSQALSGFVPMEEMPEKAYLVAVRGLKFPATLPKSGEKVKIWVGKPRCLGPLSLFEAKISNSAGVVVTQAQLKVYVE